MNQKIKDLQVLLKNDRKAQIGLGGGLLFVIICFMVASSDMSQPYTPTASTVNEMKQAMNQKASNIGSSGETVYQDLTRAFGEDIKDIKRATEDQTALISQLEHDLREHKAQSAGIFDTVVDRLETLGSEIERIEEETAQIKAGGMGGGAYPPDASAGGGGPGYAAGEDSDTLEPFGMQEATVPPPPPPEEPLRMTVISSGDSVPLKLLTGVNAPVDGTPYPVVFQLTGPITGPDGSSLDLGEARLIAAAQGSEADGRVLFRLTTLSIRHSDGRRSEVRVDGWIVGEDGIRGMKGRLIDKLGRLIAATAGVSFAAALGERIDDKADGIQIMNSDNVSVDGEDFNVASASAFTDASNRIGEILLDRYESLVPVVEILAGREVVAVFSQSAEVSVFEDEYADEGIYAASLD